MSNTRKRAILRKAFYSDARRSGLGHKAATRACQNAWKWFDDKGRWLSLSNAPRCSPHPFWVWESDRF